MHLSFLQNHEIVKELCLDYVSMHAIMLSFLTVIIALLQRLVFPIPSL